MSDEACTSDRPNSVSLHVLMKVIFQTSEWFWEHLTDRKSATHSAKPRSYFEIVSLSRRLFDLSLTESRHTPIPRLVIRSSTFQSDGEKRICMVASWRMASKNELKWQNGLYERLIPNSKPPAAPSASCFDSALSDRPCLTPIPESGGKRYVSNGANCVEKLPRDCLRMDFRKQ